jgi:hypothetical protein
MKKLTRVVGIILLMAAVCYAGLAVEVTSIVSKAFGYDAQGGRSVLREGVRGDDVISLATKIGGVLFQGIAVAAGNAIGHPVAMQYDQGKPDGQRLLLSIGDTAVTADLYDWEMIPVARYVESGYTACMTLLDEPQTMDELATHLDNANKGIMWMNFHPALGNTLVGLNLFFVDAMLVNPDLMQFADEVFTSPVPGYHITGRNLRNVGRDRRIENTAGIELLLNIEAMYGSWNSYIYTDYGTEISYRIEKNQIVFSGVPSYLFVNTDRKAETSTVAAEMNERFKKLYKNIVAINPTVYRTAERTAQWAAFFRMVQAEYPQTWQRFMGQITGIEASPQTGTPRYWLSFTERE